jgi:hypothetical protein
VVILALSQNDCPPLEVFNPKTFVGHKTLGGKLGQSFWDEGSNLFFQNDYYQISA